RRGRRAGLHAVARQAGLDSRVRRGARSRQDRARHDGLRRDGQLAASLPRARRLHLAACRVHAEERRDRGCACGPRLSGPDHRRRRCSRIAARHARDGLLRCESRGRVAGRGRARSIAMSGDEALETPAIALHGVTKRFGRTPVLSAVDARFYPGRLTGLVGPDGSGKTTLMRLMVGLLRPTEGRIEIAGRDTRLDADEIHALIGYMPQRFGLYEDLTVAENLELHAKLKRLGGAERRRAFDAALAFTRLEPFTGRLAGRLSGGMKQKLGLACALL